MAATPDNVLEDRQAPMPAVIAVEHLHKAYGATVAVDDVSFSVRAGEIFGVLGRNGAGKTTTVECLSGLRVPDGGSLDVLGLDPQEDRRELHESVGVGGVGESQKRVLQGGGLGPDVLGDEPGAVKSKHHDGD